jgi:hypothetical protein
MIDDKLTLTIATEPPVADPGTITIFATCDDGEPPAYPMVLLGDGTTRPLFPSVPTAPPQRLVTPGFHGPTIPRPLVHAEHVISVVGEANHDVPVGAVVEAMWRLAAPGVVGWGEVALIADGVAGAGRVVAHADIADLLSYPANTHGVGLPVVAPIACGDTLRLVFAVWCEPGSTQPMPQLLASAYPDPIASGGVTRVIGDLALVRPSQAAALGQPYSGDRFTTALPFVATVRLP